MSALLRHIWEELRVPQWAKNLLTLAPLLFSKNLFEPSAVWKALSAFGVFCLVSSSVYVLNDLLDVRQDRAHPIKRQRPLAAGSLSVGAAWATTVTLLGLVLAGGWLVKSSLGWILLGYWAIHLLYALVLKRLVILDALTVAIGFLLRVVAGAEVIEVAISHWILICTAMLALFLGFIKRRHEWTLLQGQAGSHRGVLAHYNLQFLDMMIAIVTSATLMSYTFYTVSDETVAKFHTEALLFTLPFVFYGVFRCLYLFYQKGEGGDPIQNVLTDLPMVINLVLWVATVVVVLYLRGGGASAL